MKSVKFASLIIPILFCSLAIGQNEIIKKDSLTQTDIIKIGSTIKEGNQPLYILDGTAVNYKEFQKIDPNAIESITVLKDSSATAVFSSRGKYGVIIIKTKKNSKKRT